MSRRLHLWPLVLLALPLLIACESRQEEPAPPVAAATTLWHALGSWSGSGDRQTESFDVTTGSMRLMWEALQDAAPGAAHFRVSLYSAISGRPLQTIVDTQEAGADTVDLGANPRVAYLVIESERVRWRVTLEEAVPRSPVSGSARD